MAGRKQHFIPKHFLKEFVVPGGRDTIWMFRRGFIRPVPVSRSDAAAARDFYSKPKTSKDSTLDDLITKYENKLKFQVDAVRSIPIDESIPSHLISEIAVHLMIRAAYIRDIFDLCFSEIITSIEEFTNRDGAVFECFKTHKYSVPLKFEEMVTNHFELHRLNQSTCLSPKAAARIIYFSIREDFDILNDIASDRIPLITHLLQDKRKGFSRTTHTRMLKHELAPKSWKSRLKTFNWKITKYPTKNAVLPDCLVIAKDKDGWSPYLMADHDSVTQIVLPMASDKLAVGCMNQDRNTVVGIYNSAARQCCFTFYLSNDSKASSDKGVGDNMRSRTTNLMSSSLTRATKEILSDTLTDTQRESPIVRWVDLTSNLPFSLEISFRDFGAKEFHKKVAGQLESIISSFANIYPVQGLDGFTFAHRYGEALQELNRGNGARKKDVKYNPNGVAMPLAVKRKSCIKTHVVLRGHIAECLVSNDNDDKLDAISIIEYCLRTAAFNTLIDRKFPGTLLSPISDPYDGYLYQFTDAILATYFSYHVFGAKEKNLEFFANQALKQLNEMVTRISEAHVDYDDQNIFKISTEYISSFLFSLARYFGASALAKEPHKLNLALDERLRQLELAKWSKLFNEDLKAFIRDLDEWKNWDEVFFVNRHFERVLLKVGVITDQLTDGSIVFHTTNEYKFFT